MLTSSQQTVLAAHIKANTNPTVVDALAIRNDQAIAEYYNGNSNTSAWISSLSNNDLFQSCDITKFDSLTAGKRDSWRMMLDFSPINFTKAKNRKAVQDIWGNTDSVAILTDCTRKATRAEEVFGGESATTNTVTALKLNWEGTLSTNDVSYALNNNP